MVPGVDSADKPRELLETVPAREREALALAESELEDVWVHLHGEHRDDSVSGFTFPSPRRRIDRAHLLVALPPFVRSTYTVCILSDHLAVALHVGPQEEPGLPPRYQFPIVMLSCEEGVVSLGGVLARWSQSHIANDWWDGVHKAVRAVGERRQQRPQTGYMHLDVLVRENSVHRLAAGATVFSTKNEVWFVAPLNNHINSWCGSLMRIGRTSSARNSWSVCRRL